MSEYIITCDEETASWIGNDVDSMQPIVRCRDCRWCVERKWHDGFECRLRPLCNFYVKPDDFCSQGERKEVDE